MSHSRSISSAAVPETASFPFLRSALILFVTFLWFGIFAVMGIDTHHDGVMLAPAVTVAHGGVPFVDNFCQYGLLPPLLQGLAVKFFGAQVIVLRLLSLLFYGGIALLLDKLSRRFLHGKWNWFPLISFWLLVPDTMVTTHPWSSVFALFFMLFELELLIGFVEEGKTKQLIGSGVCAFFAFASRHPCGVVTVFAAILTLIFCAVVQASGKRAAYFCRKSALYLAGFSGAALPAVIYLNVTCAWHDYLRQCWGFILGFVWRRGGSGSLQQLGESFFPLTGQNWLMDAIFSALPLTALLMLWLAIRKSDGNAEKLRKELPLIALLLLGLGSWHQYYPVPCVRHIFWGAVPMLIPYAVAVCRMAKTRKILAGVLIFLLLPAAGIRLFAGTMRIRSLALRRQTDLPCVRGLFLSRREAAELAFWHDVVEKMPENLKRRGIVNLTQEAFWQNFYPQCGFHHPIPMRMIESPYPERDEALRRFAVSNCCAVLTDLEDLELPRYVTAVQGFCNLHFYRLLVPAGE